MFRARKLRVDLQTYVRKHPTDGICTFSSTDWRHIDYLIEILYPFYRLTNAIGQIRNGPTIHQVFLVYDKLFNHLDDCAARICAKQEPWKKQMHEAIIAATDKLKEYYGRTQDRPGQIYGIATILSPITKMKLFQSDSWKDECDETGTLWVISLDYYIDYYFY